MPDGDDRAYAPRPFVYVGVLPGQGPGGKALHVISSYEDGTNDGRHFNLAASDRWSWDRLKVVLSVGETFTVDVADLADGKTSFKWGTLVRTGPWENREDRFTWQSRTKAVQLEAKAVAMAKRDKYADLDETLMPLRSVYFSLSGVERPAFLTLVIGGVTGYGPKVKKG